MFILTGVSRAVTALDRCVKKRSDGFMVLFLSRLILLNAPTLMIDLSRLGLFAERRDEHAALPAIRQVYTVGQNRPYPSRKIFVNKRNTRSHA
jgi:hypothetical protein